MDGVATLLSFGDSGWGDELLRGFLVTVELALTAAVFGLLLGGLLAAMKLSTFAPLRWIAQGYDVFIRGTPEFLILLGVYFAFPLLLAAGFDIVGVEAQVEAPKFAAAVAGLAMIFAAYASETLRGAFLAVPAGQIEAATAYGFSRRRAFIRIRLPQMWRFAIPGLGNLWMVLVKDTSLAAVIALDELLRRAKIAGESTGEPLLFFLAAGALYLLLTGVSDLARARAERRARRGVAR